MSPSACIVKGGIRGSRRYLPTYLSCLLVGVRVMQGVTAVHAEHHIPDYALLCKLVDDIAFCLSLIRLSYAFRFSGDWRVLILLSSYPASPRLPGRVATV